MRAPERRMLHLVISWGLMAAGIISLLGLIGPGSPAPPGALAAPLDQLVPPQLRSGNVACELVRPDLLTLFGRTNVVAGQDVYTLTAQITVRVTLSDNQRRLAFEVLSPASQVGVDAVIVKGGPLTANVYEYDEARSDSGLVSTPVSGG